ncbi:hypothetical protein FGKAn22_15560 [Ferrigenium kumadai]|uniref:Uncharacterized protein n=1 Tax=Ferrigenium kumadai TaxID=1682490 RepID=A0AAN1SZJ9_9PROT|nr:hypothetical protein FGKAn22_15560 [Ferrigenium kumadai]
MAQGHFFAHGIQDPDCRDDSLAESADSERYPFHNFQPVFANPVRLRLRHTTNATTLATTTGLEINKCNAPIP